ncbi:MAG: hypothetical protein HYX86_01630 [Chloroflexi bacterium]|nr:hypothetical protein [Chloroflexota bacterium]
MFPIFWAVFLVSGAALLFEITLIRVFSIAQGYHFAFLAVSVALLGFGASGTILVLSPRLQIRQDPRALRNIIFALSLLFSLSIPLSYLVSNNVPFDSYQIAWDSKQIAYLAIYYLSLALPFIFGGLVVGGTLASLPGMEDRLYAANLLGSGSGVVGALFALSLLGGEGSIVLSAILGGMATLPLASGIRRVSTTLGVLGIEMLLPLFAPQAFTIHMSPYKSLAQTLRYPDTEIIQTGQNAFSTVAVVEGPSLHLAPGLSLAYGGTLPRQRGIAVDGDDISPVADFEADPSFLEFLPTAVAYDLVASPKVLVLEARGGLDILQALHQGAQEVVAVESNPTIVELANGVYLDPRVKVITEIGRGFLAGSKDVFDLIVLSRADAFRPVTSGAYSLQEDYTYTVEAFVAYLEHLATEGILVVPRWFQVPPSDDLRAVATTVAALQRLGKDEPGKHIAAIRGLTASLLIVKGSEFTSQELDVIRSFAQEKKFDLVYYWGMPPEEADRFYTLSDQADYWAYRNLIEARNHEEFFSTYDYDVSAPNDDKPFFFHFFTIQLLPEILASWGKVFQPFGGSGFLVLWALLALAVVASLILILIPLFRLPRVDTTAYRGRFFLYFTLLGLGFLFVEIPLIQKFILFLGHPVYALGGVLFGILLFSSLGSYLSPKMPFGFLLALAVVIFIYPLILPPFFQALLGWPLLLRLLATVITLAPLGTLMGIPFPKGLALVGRTSPGLVPWVWGINGFASVLSSILAAILALSSGFSLVLNLAAGFYFLAWAAIHPFPKVK